MKSLKYEGVGFNADLLSKRIIEGLTEKQFVEEKIDAGLYPKFTKSDRVKLLKEVYRKVKQM